VSRHRRTSLRTLRIDRRRAVLAILVLALAVRLIVVFTTPHWSPRTDSANYDSVAVSLVQHGSFGPSETSLTGVVGPTAFRAPLYPLALAAVYSVVGVSDPARRWEAGRIEEAVFGVVAVWLIVLIAERIWPERPRIALIAGTLAALDPPLVLAGSSLMTESLFIPLSLAAVLCGLRARAALAVPAAVAAGGTAGVPAGGRARGRAGLAWCLAAGGLVGAAALTRTTGLILIVPLAVMVGWPQRRRVLVPAVVLGAFLLALVPWTVRNYDVFHQFVPLSTEDGYALAGIYTNAIQHAHPYPALWQPPVADFTAVHAAHPGYDEAQYSAALTTVVRHYIVAHPVSVIRTAALSLLRMLNLDGFQLERIAARGDAYPVWLALASIPAFWVLGLTAVAGAGTRLARRPGFWFWGCALAMLLICLPVIGTTRYRVPVDPWLVLLAALALETALARRRAPTAPTAPTAPAAVVN
jgi:4-amino-4-deoxy-L-arabinose transferase-like glycosyltransferase